MAERSDGPRADGGGAAGPTPTVAAAVTAPRPIHRSRPTGGPGAAGTATHRPHLDGLRAVAVYLVVAFHAGSGRLAGGFIGVDVFFVLSGYLVTEVLLRDAATHGSIRFGRFYARRVRRLLPASIAVLLATAVLYTAIASTAEVIEAASAFRAAFLYVANWFFIDRSTGYFADDSARSPVLHLWSLAVEEQFYVLWPLLLGGLLWAGRRLGPRRPAMIRVVVGAAALASAAWAYALRVDHPDRAYFGTDTRAYQLLAGALLALTPTLVARAARWRRGTAVVAPLGLAAVVVLATDRLQLDPIERGLAVTVATCVVLVALDAAAGGPARRLLSLGPVTYLGTVSYGTYLWHWPVILLIEDGHEVAPLPLAVIVALVATGLAALSHQLLELPLRRSRHLDRFTWPVAAVGLALSVVAGVVVVPEVVRPDAGRASAGAVTDAADFTPIPSTIDPAEVFFEGYGETVDCVDLAPERCTVVHGDGPHLLLMGDSNAQMWVPALTEVARREDLSLSLSVVSGCPWERDVYRLSPEIQAACRRMKEDAYERVIPALDPDLIVLVGAREPMGPLQVTYTDTAQNRALREQTERTLEQLERDGRDVLVIEPAPLSDEDINPRECLEEAEVVEACRFVVDARPSWHEVLERDLDARSDHLTVADLDRLVCPFLPICDPVVGGTVVFWNRQHLAARYARSLAPEVADYLRDEGLIPG